jgi:hypothetical protein
MKRIVRMTSIFRVAMFTAVVLPSAYAGCGDTRGLQGSYTFADSRLLLPGSHAETRPTATADAFSAVEGASIVGMWNITFSALGNSTRNPPIPDGAVVDFGYSIWHSDGTEFLNSGSRPPATQNFCLGVWTRTGYSTFQLNHFALSYDQTSGAMNGRVQIQETITLSPDGNSYTGTFTIDVYDPNGKIKEDHVQGTVTAKRVTITTTFPQ